MKEVTAAHWKIKHEDFLRRSNLQFHRAVKKPAAAT